MSVQGEMSDGVQGGTLPGCDLSSCSCVTVNSTTSSALPACNTTACQCLYPFDTATFLTHTGIFGVGFIILTVLACSCLNRMRFRPELFDAFVATDQLFGGVVVKEKTAATKAIIAVFKVVAVLLFFVAPLLSCGLWAFFVGTMKRAGGNASTL